MNNILILFDSFVIKCVVDIYHFLAGKQIQLFISDFPKWKCGETATLNHNPCMSLTQR